MNQKIQYKKTKSDISEFHKTLPDKRDFTKIINFISTGAKKNSLKMPAITYQQEKADDAKRIARRLMDTRRPRCFLAFRAGMKE